MGQKKESKSSAETQIVSHASWGFQVEHHLESLATFSFLLKLHFSFLFLFRSHPHFLSFLFFPSAPTPTPLCSFFSSSSVQIPLRLNEGLSRKLTMLLIGTVLSGNLLVKKLFVKIVDHDQESSCLNGQTRNKIHTAMSSETILFMVHQN